MRKDELIQTLIKQSFSAQADRIVLQNEKIAAQEETIAELKKQNTELWEILQKVDEKLEFIYSSVFGESGKDVFSLAEYKFGEEKK